DLRPLDLAASDRRTRPHTGRAHLRGPPSPAEGAPALDLPLRHGLERAERALGRCALPPPAGPGRASSPCERTPLRLGRKAVRRLPRPASGRAPRRDARLRARREAALT